ncbi:MAG TPA: YhjD/YihY/BrkB family envelope integrity protein [Longimicrobiaceae bacterium]
MPSGRRPASSGGDRPPVRSLSELLRSFAADAAELVRREIALARAEVRAAVRSAARGFARISVGIGVGGLGLLTILAGIVVLLGELIGSYWLAALLVGAILLVIGALSTLGGMRRIRSADPTPRQAIAAARDTVGWAKEEAAALRTGLLGRRGHGEPGKDAPGLAGARITAEARPRRFAVASSDHGTALPTGRGYLDRAPVSEGAGLREPGGAVALASRTDPRPPPPREAGWKAFVKHLWGEIQSDEITGHAAKLAFYAFLALPPALMALFGLAGLIGSEAVATWLRAQASIALPPAVSEGIIDPFIEQVVLQEAPGPFSIGLLLALWGGSSVFAGLIDTLNHAYDLQDTRSYLRKRLLALAVMFASVVLFLAAAGTLLLAPALVEAVGLGRVGTIIWNLVQWPLAFAFMVAAFWGAYYFLPDRDQRGSNWVLIRAAALAAALWVLATAGFRIYIANFSSYSETYGFLGAFIILLLWLYVTGLVVLVGGELASELEKRAA